MLREAEPWHWIMATIVIVMFGATAALKRRDQAGIAFGLGTMSMGLLMLFMASELLALCWTSMGACVLVWELAASSPPSNDQLFVTQQGPDHRIRALVVIAAVWLGLVSLIVMRYLPGETYLIDSGPRIVGDMSRQVTLLIHSEHAPALLAVGLVLLVALMGGHRYRGNT